MAITLTQRVQVQIFDATAYGEFHDSLYYPTGQVPEDGGLADATARVNAWVALVSTPVTPLPPTNEDLANQAQYLASQAAPVNEALVTAGLLNSETAASVTSAVTAALTEIQTNLSA
jgi:hypothetical protein